MISLNYAKKVLGGYVLNFYADSYKEVRDFPVNKPYKTYGLIYPGSVITVVENGIKTNYVLTADREWIELSLNNYAQIKEVKELPLENISTNTIYKVPTYTGFNKNYIFGQEFDIFTLENMTNDIIIKISSLLANKGIPE